MRIETLVRELEKRGEAHLLDDIVGEFVKENIERQARIEKYSNDGNDYL